MLYLYWLFVHIDVCVNWYLCVLAALVYIAGDFVVTIAILYV